MPKKEKEPVEPQAVKLLKPIARQKTAKPISLIGTDSLKANTEVAGTFKISGKSITTTVNDTSNSTKLMTDPSALTFNSNNRSKILTKINTGGAVDNQVKFRSSIVP